MNLGRDPIQEALRKEAVVALGTALVQNYIKDRKINPRIELEGYVEDWLKLRLHPDMNCQYEIFDFVMRALSAMRKVTRKEKPHE